MPSARRLLVLALLAGPLPAAAAGFVSLDLPGSQAVAISADGCIVAGNLLGDAGGGFRWSAAGGAERLAGAVSVQGLSASGAYVAGAVLDGLQRQFASYWDAAGMAHPLDSMPGIESLGVVSQAQAINDEPRIVGNARRPGGGSIAFEWTPRHGMRSLPGLAAGASGRAVGVSRDGNRIVGWEQRAGQTTGIVWRNGQALPLPIASGAPAELSGASRDAALLFGLRPIDGAAAAAAYRWRDAATLELLATTPEPAAAARFHAGSDDGRVLAGGSDRGGRRAPWVWIAGEGFVALPDLLARYRVAVPPGWQLLALTAVSGNGERLAGWGKRDGQLDSFVVDLTAGGPAGACTLPAVARTVQAP
ncbi:hypothetical protein [Dokdonella koreensis]|uniref:hypothetical protein n=1 Tax=Dokdonella koreensis TaxID=323415 RepID=UPI000829ED17|nr:hypothetical protein [Dokdonella koreensis]